MPMLLEANTVLSGVVTAEMVNGVFDEILALLPILVPCIVTFAGIRKGISFLRSTIAGA